MCIETTCSDINELETIIYSVSDHVRNELAMCLTIHTQINHVPLKYFVATFIYFAQGRMFACHGSCVEIRRQPRGVDSLLSCVS